MSTLVRGHNDLHAWCISNNREDLLREWDYSLNEEVTPYDVSRSSNKPFYWKCLKCGNTWKARPNSRTRTRNSGCPYCSGRKVLDGKNDLAALFPDIASEWNFDRNEKEPTDYCAHSSCVVWWKGACKHEWKDSISHRTGRSSGCPVCYSQIRTSFPEQAVFFYVKQYFPDAINGDRSALDGKELDVFIPSQRIAVEYDGQAWHRDKRKDEEKNALCEKRGIVLYRIRERECWFWDETKYLKLIGCSARNFSDLENAIQCLLIFLGRCAFPDVDIYRDETEIRGLFIKRKQEESIEKLFPLLAKEWHPTLNGSITPDMVTTNSSMMAWWQDKLGHEWKARVYSRTKGAGCPYCSTPARRLLTGFNDFATKHPDISAEWDYEKNTVSPMEVLYGASRCYWWRCASCGNSFLASPANRHNGTGCPQCAIEKRNASKHKSVRNIDTEEVFQSMNEACLKYNLTSSNLSKCCSGKRPTCGGFHWEYVK